MNIYTVQHRVRTVLEFWKEGYEFEGFIFQQWSFSFAEGPHGNSWIVRKDIEAIDVYEAISTFRTELFPILSMMCFIGQCEMIYHLESFLVCRKNDNVDNIFFLRYSHEVAGVSLHFDEKEQRTLQIAIKYTKPVVFEYLQDANNAANYFSRLSLLIMALEGIAGEVRTAVTDKEYIKNEILQDNQLYHDIFDHGTGYRNKLFHGKRDSSAKDLCDIIYSCIIKYFNRKHGFEIDETVVSVPRSESGNYSMQDCFFQLKDTQIKMELKSIIELLDSRKDKYSSGDSTDKQLKSIIHGTEVY